MNNLTISLRLLNFTFLLTAASSLFSVGNDGIDITVKACYQGKFEERPFNISPKEETFSGLYEQVATAMAVPEDNIIILLGSPISRHALVRDFRQELVKASKLRVKVSSAFEHHQGLQPKFELPEDIFWTAQHKEQDRWDQQEEDFVLPEQQSQNKKDVVRSQHHQKIHQPITVLTSTAMSHLMMVSISTGSYLKPFFSATRRKKMQTLVYSW